jgi:hypothetical protein
MMLKSLVAKADSLASLARDKWIAKIKDFASTDIVTIQAEQRVLDHAQDLLSWKIDFIVVKDKDKIIRGVIGRDQFNDLLNEKLLQTRMCQNISDLNLHKNLSHFSFRDLIASGAFQEYYVIDQDHPSTVPNLWMQGLPPREVVIIKDKVVDSVVDRRWFKRWQSLIRFACYFGP